MAIYILSESCHNIECVKKPVFNTFSGAARGDFCFFLNGTRGDVDSNIRDVPVNVECDPRVTCEQSVKQDQCRDEYPTMNFISVSDTSFTYSSVTLLILQIRTWLYPMSIFGYMGKYCINNAVLLSGVCEIKKLQEEI